MSEVAERVSALLDLKGPTGAPKYSDEEVKAAVPLLCAGVERARGPTAAPIVWPKFVLVAIGEIADRAGVTAASTSEQMWDAILAYYTKAAFPLLDELTGILKFTQSVKGADDAKALAALIGGHTSTGVLQTGQRPTGTARAGPGARFAALAAFEKKTISSSH